MNYLPIINIDVTYKDSNIQEKVLDTTIIPCQLCNGKLVSVLVTCNVNSSNYNIHTSLPKQPMFNDQWLIVQCESPVTVVYKNFQCLKMETLLACSWVTHAPYLLSKKEVDPIHGLKCFPSPSDDHLQKQWQSISVLNSLVTHLCLNRKIWTVIYINLFNPKIKK